MAKPFLVICRKFFHVFIVGCYIPVALLGLRCTGFWCFYIPSAPLGLLEAGAQCTPYKLYFSNRLLADADRESYHDDLHWHVSNNGQESSWSNCVNQPGVYQEGTCCGYDFSKCDKEDPPEDTLQINPTPEAIQEYLFPTPPEPKQEPVFVPVRYSFDDFALNQGTKSYSIAIGVRRNGNYSDKQEVTVTVSPDSVNNRYMWFQARHRIPHKSSGSPITTQPLGGIISLGLTQSKESSWHAPPTGTRFTITATITAGGRTWNKSQSFVWGEAVWTMQPTSQQQQFEPVEIIYLDTTEPVPVPKGAEVAPTSESTEPQLASGNGKEAVPYTPTYQPELQPIPDSHVSYSMTFPAGVNSLHLPFKPRKAFFFTDLVNLLGDANVNSISVLRPTVQVWTIVTSSHSVHNEWISRYRGFVADMKNTVTVDLTREPVDYGYDIIYLKEGQNLIGVPRQSSQLEVVSDFFVVFDSVMWVELIEDGQTLTRFRPQFTTEMSTLDGNALILPTHGYMLMSLEDDEYPVWGDAWGDVINQLPQREE